jgi:hypothetical protein
MASAPPTPSAELISSFARERLARQLTTIESLDSKAATLIGFAGVVLGLLFTSPLTDRWNLLLSLGAVVVGVSVLPLALAIVPRRYRMNPGIPALSALAAEPPDVTYGRTTNSIVRAIEYNTSRVRWKVWATNAGIAMVTAGVVLVMIGLVYSVETQEAPNSNDQKPVPVRQERSRGSR